MQMFASKNADSKRRGFARFLARRGNQLHSHESVPATINATPERLLMTPPATPRLFGAKHAAILCVIALLIAFAINALFNSESLFAIARKGEPPLRQFWIGALIGTSIASLMLAAFSVGRRYFTALQALSEQMFALFTRVDVSGLSPLLIGITAGLWEEVFFRAALQPLLGIWWGSLIFMLCHSGTGQFWKMNGKKAVYALGVFAAGLMLGFIFEKIGLVAAIATHACIDIMGLFAMRHFQLASFATQQDS